MQKYFRPLLKSELAEGYGVCVRTLINWLVEYPELVEKLHETDYYDSQKMFTLKQVEIIYKYISLPSDCIENNLTKIPVRVYSKQNLARHYQISLKTLQRMIKNDTTISYLSQKKNKKYNYSEVELIFEHLGQPYLKT